MVILRRDHLPPPTLLVVDDDLSTRSMLSTLLRMDGYTLHAARDGREALELLSLHPPLLILVDLEMLGMGGEESRKAQWALSPELANIPVLNQSPVDTTATGPRRVSATRD